MQERHSQASGTTADQSTKKQWSHILLWGFFSVLVHTPARIMAWSFNAALTLNANIEFFFLL